MFIMHYTFYKFIIKVNKFTQYFKGKSLLNIVTNQTKFYIYKVLNNLLQNTFSYPCTFLSKWCFHHGVI